jgi:ABC-2 type transport system permease protein
MLEGMETSMKKTLLVMANEIGASLRRKMFVFFGFGVPLILGAIALGLMLVNRDRATDPFADPASRSGPAAQAEITTEGYVDTGNLIRKIPDDIPAGSLVEYGDASAAQAALDAGEISGYYIIAPDYVHTGDLTYVKQEHTPFGSDPRTDSVEWILLVNVLGGDEELAARVWEPLDIRVTPLAVSDAKADEDNWIVELFPTLMVLILYMVIILPAGVLVNAITDEKKNRVMEVLMTSVSTRQMITGKILALAVLGLLQTALWVGVMWAVIRFGGRPLSIPPGFTVPTPIVFWTLIYFLGGYAIYGAALAGLGALAPDFKDTRGATMILLSPLILAYMFNMAIILRPDGPVALALSLFPLSSPISMIARMAATDVPVWQGALAAALQLLAAILIVRFVSRLFRTQHLLSGQPFSIQRYYKALLERA